MIPQDHIRNFSIIAHIDHGKSTLSDRLIEICGAVEERIMEDQILDNMDLERERGITIKARAVGLNYKAENGETYVLNLIDTPGHVDFNYEVSRSLAACEGAVLVVDASQGVEAQTLANTYLALDAELEILPVINKIDLPAADPQRVKHEIEDIIGILAMDAPEISAKNGINVESVLEDIVANVPAPTGDVNAPLKALIFDSQYDSYRGVIVFMSAFLTAASPRATEVLLHSTGSKIQVVLEVGHDVVRSALSERARSLRGRRRRISSPLRSKTVSDTQVGDTVTTRSATPCAEALPGYRPARADGLLRAYITAGRKQVRQICAMRWKSFSSTTHPCPSSLRRSAALGFGFRCGFLGHAAYGGHSGTPGARI